MYERTAVMPSVLLSACGGDAEYCNGANEAAVMGAILSLLQEYLQVSGLRASLRPDEAPSTMAASIANRQRADFLFTIRSSAGQGPGIEICYHPASEKSRRAAALLQEALQPVCVDAQWVKLLPVPQLPEFRMAKCPCVQLRLGDRGDPEDAQWMLQCTGVIAHALAKALTAWFDVPCKSPFSQREAEVRVPSGTLALRRAPRADAELLRPLPNGANLLLLHREGDWQYAEFEGACGYVLRKFLRLL